MDFSRSDNEKIVAELADQILGKEIDDDYQKSIDRSGLRFDQALWQRLAAAGLLGIAIDEHYGGMGMSFVELCVLLEKIGKYVAPVPVVPTLVSAALTLQRFASGELKQRILPEIVSGHQLVTSAFLEPGGDVRMHCQTRAQRQGSIWQIDGEKWCVPCAKQASQVLLTAQTESGLGLFLVDPSRPGVSLEEMPNTAKEPQYCMSMKAVDVPLESVVVLGQIEHVLEWMYQHTTLAYCAMQTGLADSAMRMTASFTAERKQFGVPIATFQAVAHKAANCYIDIYAQRLVTLEAVALLVAGHDAVDAVHIAKIWAGDCGHRVSYAAQHLHGGAGVDKTYALWRYCIWMRHIEMLLGSSAFHMQQLAERIARGQAAPI